MFGRLMLVYVAISTAASQNIIDAGSSFLDNTLQCHTKPYTFRVTQADENGKQCWDTLSVMACWGRCDSNEVSTFLTLQASKFSSNKKNRLLLHDCFIILK